MQIIVSFIFCIITAILAWRKGYSPLAWFLAAGCIGLCILAFLPFTNKTEPPTEKELRWRRTGNTIGMVISGFAILILLSQLGK
jgi:hypothetical protein